MREHEKWIALCFSDLTDFLRHNFKVCNTTIFFFFFFSLKDPQVRHTSNQLLSSRGLCEPRQPNTKPKSLFLESRTQVTRVLAECVTDGFCFIIVVQLSTFHRLNFWISIAGFVLATHIEIGLLRSYDCIFYKTSSLFVSNPNTIKYNQDTITLLVPTSSYLGYYLHTIMFLF